MVAFLAAEQAGDIRLELRPNRALFGLRTVQALYSVRLPGPGGWPSESLEAWIIRRSGRVYQVVYDTLVAEDVGDSDDGVLKMIRHVLVSRGLLHAVDVAEKIWFVSYTSWHYELGEGVRSLAADYTEAVEHLIRKCKTDRPEVWDDLMADVYNAFVNAHPTNRVRRG